MAFSSFFSLNYVTKNGGYLPLMAEYKYSSIQPTLADF